MHKSWCVCWGMKWKWERASGHAKPIFVELEGGSYRNMTPETITRLSVEIQKKRDLCPCLLMDRERLICNDPKKTWAGLYFFPSRQSPAIPVHMGTAIPVLKNIENHLYHLVNAH